jgi:hypothetical protein
MNVELLTLAAVSEHLKCSPETARSLANQLRLPSSRSNDGNMLVSIGGLIDAVEITMFADDIAEMPTVPSHSTRHGVAS